VAFCLGQDEIVFSQSLAADVARRLPEFTEYRLAGMDAAGIDIPVLSCTVPGVQADVDAATARRHGRLANDYLTRVVAGHPNGRTMRRASASARRSRARLGRPAPRPTTGPAADDRTPATNGELVAATAFVQRRRDA
jgi:hypothetical protein